MKKVIIFSVLILSLYAKNNFVPEVQEEFWQEVKSENTVQYYEMYLSEYPTGYYLNTAQDNIEILKKKEKDDIQAKKIEKDEWINIKKSTTSEIFTSYMNDYPNSKYFKLAKLKEMKYKKKSVVMKDEGKPVKIFNPADIKNKFLISLESKVSGPKVEKEFYTLANTRLKEINYSVSDRPINMSNLHKTKYHSTQLSSLTIMPIYNDKLSVEIIKKYPSMGAFFPINLVSYKHKDNSKTFMKYVNPSLMADIIGVKDIVLRKKFINNFDTLDRMLENWELELDGERNRTNSVLIEKGLGKWQTPIGTFTKNLPVNKPLLQFSAPINTNIDMWMESFQKKIEFHFQIYFFSILGYKNFAKSWDRYNLKHPFDEYFVYKIHSIGISYRLMEHNPEASAFFPSSLYFYVNKDENIIYAGILKAETWISFIDIEYFDKDLYVRLDEKIIEIMESIGMKLEGKVYKTERTDTNRIFWQSRTKKGIYYNKYSICDVLLFLAFVSA